MKTILLVDDEPCILLFIQLTLTEDMEEAGSFQVLTATNGQDACKILQDQSQPLDLVITDLKHPGMDGIELLLFIKGFISQSLGKDLPVIVFTAGSYRIDDFALNFADAVIIKSSEMDELIDAIRKLVVNPHI